MLISPLDFFILLNAIVCFVIYLLVHLVVFRFLAPDKIIKWLIYAFIIGAMVNMISSLTFININGNMVKDFGIYRVSLSAVLTIVVYSFLSFLYIITVFGPYETSVRVRLIRELYQAYPQGRTLKQILVHYNDEYILQQRLKRLVGSRDLFFDGTHYRYQKHFNFFGVINFLVDALRKVYGR